ncbi:hypothetical protein [Paenibacillus sp. J14]|uniref:hypothetical protein n=1 Tax=Paenibacillus sp. (strain J14) TaxID=935845 RepID=UPI00049010AF|nr:hypothetical protein [Paenibacillus sp. J14]
MEAIEINNHIEILERIRMHYVPSKYIKKFISTTLDIYNERHLLKSVAFDNNSIEYIAEIIVNDIKANRRFRRVECLKILKRIIKNRASNEQFSKALLNNLFYLYQSFILNSSDDIQWAVSTFIKDQTLEDDHIIWLIDNYAESDHIVNRLLRYPVRHKFILDWAQNVYKERQLQERISEVIGILIEDEVPEYINVNNRILMWAIYYSKVSLPNKRKMILKHLDYHDYSPAIEVAKRLGFGEISSEILNYYYGLLNRRDDVV